MNTYTFVAVCELYGEADEETGGRTSEEDAGCVGGRGRGRGRGARGVEPQRGAGTEGEGEGESGGHAGGWGEGEGEMKKVQFI